jgi:dCTP diphosphatase
VTSDLLQELAAFRDARGWARYHTPRNLAEAISVESGELLQCFLWDGAFPRGNHEHELADVLIYALNLCHALGLNPDEIVRRKIALNAEKYPVTA